MKPDWDLILAIVCFGSWTILLAVTLALWGIHGFQT